MVDAPNPTHGVDRPVHRRTEEERDAHDLADRDVDALKRLFEMHLPVYWHPGERVFAEVEEWLDGERLLHLYTHVGPRAVVKTKTQKARAPGTTARWSTSPDGQPDRSAVPKAAILDLTLQRPLLLFQIIGTLGVTTAAFGIGWLVDMRLFEILEFSLFAFMAGAFGTTALNARVRDSPWFPHTHLRRAGDRDVVSIVRTLLLGG